jgi:HD-GYP domain-containing protein (c-di-GMP phosphodiesterase class II)
MQHGGAGQNAGTLATGEDTTMTETQTLLGKIAALRQRLEQARGLAEDAAVTLVSSAAGKADSLAALRQKVAVSAEVGALMESTLRRLPGLPQSSEESALPAHLTVRARRLLPKVRDLLARLRRSAEEPLLNQDTSGQNSLSPTERPSPTPILPYQGGKEENPLAALHREITLLAELVVRALQTLPETPTVQLRLCEGVEAVLKMADLREAALGRAIEQRRQEEAQITTLAGLLDDLAHSKPAVLAPLTTLAESILKEAAQAQPLRFLAAPPSDLLRFVACHSLTVARVAARIVRCLPEWRTKVQEPVLAALVHDVGMLRVPTEVLASPGPLDEAGRRAVEKHALAGAEMLACLGPDAAWLRDAALGHHERLDGTGYPSGLTDLQIGPLLCLLAVCDVYAALCCPRPHRPALDTRTAMTDTLLLAQQGALDSDCAKALLELSLYPVGTAVELADGALGIVVATHQGSKDIASCARPVVALLTDSEGRPLAFPTHLDLAECEGRSIVRSLPAEQRRRLLGETYPEWV